jgi:hypothetical protein
VRTFVLVFNFSKSTSPLTQGSIALAVVRTATFCFRLVGKSEGAQYTISLVNPLAVTWNVLATSWKSLGSEAPWQR